MRNVFIHYYPAIEIIVFQQLEQYPIHNTIPFHVSNGVYLMPRFQEKAFEPNILIFVQEYLHAAISDKSLAAANSITASACCRVTEGNPRRNSSKVSE